MSGPSRACARLAVVLCALGLAAGALSCRPRVKPPEAKPRYETLPAKQVPGFMKDTIFERTDLWNTEPQIVTGYGLVVNLAGTGAGPYPTLVREYMLREMSKRGFGSKLMPGFEKLTPSQVLNDPRVAIVQVTGYMPPGARESQRFDVRVSALPLSQTSSLHRGDLYRTDLVLPGANPGVNVQARCEGPIFVNPALAMESLSGSVSGGATARASLRSGWVMDGGVVVNERPIVLRLLTPSRAVARLIESRVDEHFQDTSVAAAQDEGLVLLYVPHKFRGDWQHFVGIVTHLYLNNSPAIIARKARELAEEAVKPDAPLMDISYCWEGLGAAALPTILPLMAHEDPAVQYASARVAAFLGDTSAQSALLKIASTSGHEFQINAVQTLGALPASPAVNHMLRRLLDSDQTLVRVEAYKVLARNRDPIVFTKVVNERFVLDLVPTDGPPFVYASRRGMPRIAVFGRGVSIETPIVWTAMNERMMISSQKDGPNITLFYRDDRGRTTSMLSRPDLAEVIARLGGEGPKFEKKFDFTYADVVGIMQLLSEQKRLTARGEAPTEVSFMLEDLPAGEMDVLDAVPLPEPTRPQTDAEKVGAAQ